ncbi:MAG: hypothetical protein QW154_03060 [Sulfolobales archaeon]
MGRVLEAVKCYHVRLLNLVCKKHKLLTRGSVSTLAASIIALLALSQVVAAVLYSISNSSRYLIDVAGAISRASSAEIHALRLSNGSIKLVTSLPIKILAAYLTRNGTIVEGYGGGLVEEEIVFSTSASGGDSLLLILEGGKFLVIPLQSLGELDSGKIVLENVGYKLSIAHVLNYAEYLAYGPIHVRTAMSQPPTYADTGYRPLFQGNAVFYFTGLTYSIQTGNHWRVDGEYLVVYPNQAILVTGVSQNPVALTQVLRVVKGSDSEVKVSVRVEISNTSITQYYPRILVVYYVIPGKTGLQLPAAIYQPPAVDHEPWLSREVLYLAQPGQLAIEYSGEIKLSGISKDSYVLIGTEVITLGIGTAVKASISISV